MTNKRKIAIISLSIALIALIIIILGMVYFLTSTPKASASLENIVVPAITPILSSPTQTTPTINIRDSEGDDGRYPIMRKIPDITLKFGETRQIYLENYGTDEEDKSSDLVFSCFYTASTTPAPLTITLSNNILTITESNGEWEGNESIRVRVKNTDKNYDETEFEVIINNGTVIVDQEKPIITEDFPNSINFTQGESFSLSLNSYVTHPSTPIIDLSWTYSGNDNVEVSMSSEFDVLFTSPDWNGNETITFRVTDPEGNYDEAELNVIVFPREDEPKQAISWLTLQNKAIEGISPKGTIIYSNILSRLNQSIHSSEIQITLSGNISSLTLKLLNGDLVLDSVVPIQTTVGGVRYTPALSGIVTLNYIGTEFQQVNQGIFQLNVIGCQEHTTFEEPFWICA